MNAAFEAAVDALVAIVKSVNAVLSVIPGLIWALAIAGVFLWGGWQRHERSAAEIAQRVAEKARDVAVGEKGQVLAQLEQQKKDAAAKLATLTAERDSLQAIANEMHRKQEIQDANNRKTIAEQAARLRALAAAAPGGQLRDPNAPGCGSGGASAEAHSATDGRGSEEHGAAAGGLVSAQLGRLLLEQAADADKWGRLYGLARADALMCRAAMGASP